MDADREKRVKKMINTYLDYIESDGLEDILFVVQQYAAKTLNEQYRIANKDK